MLGRCFLFLDVFVDQAGHAAATKASGRFIFGFALWITHETAVKRLFRPDEVIIVKSELAALAALQILCH